MGGLGIMRIIIVNDYATVNGGAGKIALESAISLSKAGHQVDVFCGVGDAPEGFENENLKLHSLKTKKYGEFGAKESFIRSVANPLTIQGLTELLKSCDPKNTVVHIHSWRDSLSASFMEPVLKGEFKFVVTAHDYSLACPYSGFYNFGTNTICGKTALSLGCLTCRCNGGSMIRKHLTTVRQVIQKTRFQLPKSLKHLITVSDFSGNILRPYLPSTTKIHSVMNPVNIEQKPRPQCEKAKSYVFVGRLTIEKDPRIAAEACRQAGVALTIVGEGALLEELKSDYPEVTFTGWQNSAQVHDHMRNSRALIFPSVWYEAAPITPHEALAVGIPSIVSDVCASSEMVRARKCGLVFETSNVNDLIKKIQEMESEEIAQQLSETGYNDYWANPHTNDRHVKDLEKVYSEVLAD
jgi:glycosyltransferase involved in cell wall biosynthesis